MVFSALLVLAAPGWAQAPAASPPSASPPAASSASASPPTADARPPRIATADFAVQSAFRNPVLSPDGTHLAARVSVKGQQRIGVFDLTGKTQAKTFSAPKGNELNKFFWAGNATLLISMGQVTPWYDDIAYATRLMVYDLNTGAVRQLTQAIGGLRGDDVLWIDPEGKSLLLAYQTSAFDYPQVGRVDIATGKATKVTNPYSDIWDWYADANGVVRYGFGYTSDHNWQMVYRKGATDKFKVVLKGNDDRDDGSMLEIFKIESASDQSYIFGRDEKSGLWGLYRYDFGTAKRGELVFAAPANDLDAAAVNEAGDKLVWASWTDSRNRIKWFDEKLAALQDQLDKAVGENREAWISSHSGDYQMLVVYLTSPTDPGSYYLFNQAEGAMHRFARANEVLQPAQLAPTRYQHYKARDGREIAAYVTLPRGRPAKGLPLVILPHGGPFGVRDEGDYDMEVQFLANRGYVVLQPQFRGSGGFGKGFDDAAKSQWGRAMQDDLDDGMDWLVGQGVVDPKRACVVGSSYGGYAALWAATRNPERYRCAASFAGISDVPRWLKYSGRFLGTHHRENWRAQLQGDKTFDLKTVSPLYTVDRLKVPVLVAHGEDDSQVPPRQSKDYVAALKAAGKEHVFVSIPEEGHGFTTAAHAQLWLDQLDAFLKQHNPAD